MGSADGPGPSARGAGRALFGRIGVDNPLKPLQAVEVQEWESSSAVK